MTTTSLTDRYVDDTLRRVPARQRPDIERELRASIADAIDDRRHAGADAAGAERAVLTALGDPARLAAGYADRPLHLIGPAFYPEYTRLLVALVATVLPAVAVAVAALQGVDGATAGHTLGEVVGTTVTVGVHLAFWTTLVFALIERTGATAARTWRVEDLPEPAAPRARIGGLVAGAVLLGIASTLLLLSRTVSTVRDPGGRAVPMLSPWLWDTGVIYAFVGFAMAGLGFAVAERFIRWNAVVAIARALVDAACPAILILVALTGHVFNPPFVDAVGWPDQAVRWTAIALVLVGAGSLLRTAFELVAGFTRRAWVNADLRALVQTAADGLAQLPRRRSAGA